MSNYFFEQEKKRQMSQGPTEQEVVDFNKKKTLRNFENKSATFGSFNPFEKSGDIGGVDNKLRQEFYNDTGKKYDFLGDTDESFNNFLVKKYGITSEEHKEATTNFWERGLLNTSKMLLGGARNISRAGSGIGQKIGTSLRDTDFISGIRESNFGKDYLQPIAEKTKEYLPKGAETLSADFLNLGEGISDVAMSVGMPIGTTLFNIAGEQDQTKGVVQGFGELLQKGGEYVNKIPGLSHFRDNLSDRDKQRFDMFVGGGMFGLISGAKIRDAKGKLSFKALKNTDIIEAFLDIDRGEIPGGTVIGEVATGIKKGTKYLYGKSKQAVNYFDGKIKEKTNLVKETPKKENIPQKKTVSVEKTILDESEIEKEDFLNSSIDDSSSFDEFKDKINSFNSFGIINKRGTQNQYVKQARKENKLSKNGGFGIEYEKMLINEVALGNKPISFLSLTEYTNDVKKLIKSLNLSSLVKGDTVYVSKSPEKNKWLSKNENKLSRRELGLYLGYKDVGVLSDVDLLNKYKQRKQKKTISAEKQHQTPSKKENTPKKEDLTLKNYNKNNPGHKLFDEIKNDIKEKKTKNIDDGDYVLLKDGTFGEVMKTTDGKYQINTPDFYSKKKVERGTKTYDKLDIETAYKQEKINDSEIYNMMKNDEKFKEEVKNKSPQYDLEILNLLEDSTSDSYIQRFMKDNKIKYDSGELKNVEHPIKKIIRDIKKKTKNYTAKQVIDEIKTYDRKEKIVNDKIDLYKQDLEEHKKYQRLFANFDKYYFRKKVDKKLLTSFYSFIEENLGNKYVDILSKMEKSLYNMYKEQPNRFFKKLGLENIKTQVKDYKFEINLLVYLLKKSRNLFYNIGKGSLFENYYSSLFKNFEVLHVSEYLKNKNKGYNSPDTNLESHLPKIVEDYKKFQKTTQSIIELKESIAQAETEIKNFDIEKKILKDRYKLKKAKETYTKNLGIRSLVSSYRKGEISLGKSKKIFRDNLIAGTKSLFSGDTIHGTLDQIKKEDKAMANRLLRATSNKYNRTAKYLSLFDNFKKERRKNDGTILGNMYKKYIKGKNLKKEMLNWTVETYKKADEGIDVLNKEQRKVFDELHELKKKYGFNENYKKNYIPKVVKDYDGFLKFIGKDTEFSNILKEITIEKEMILNRKLTEKEKAGLMNDFLNENLGKQRNKSAKISSALSRKIDAKTPELLQFYHNPSDAIDINIKSTLEGIEMLETLYGEKVNLKMDENGKVGDSILSYIDKKVMDGTYTFKEAQRMEKLLLRRFTEPSPTNFFEKNVGTYKNILINMNIGSITSAISNLKDFGTSAYKYGFINTIKYITPSAIKKFQKYMDHYISLDEMGIDALSLDFQNNGNFQKFTNGVMTISGFKLLDRVGKEVSLNASYSKFQDWAKKGDSKRDVYIEGRKTEKIFKDMGFSKKEIIQIKKDFKDGKFTDDIKMALLHEITGIQPIDKNAIPPNYSGSITGKLFYTFKTFLVKKMSFYQKEFFDVNRAKNPKEGARRGVRLIRFGMMCMMFGMGTDEVKDMIMGRKTPISDQVFSNVLEFLMVSKYTFYMFKEQTDLGNYWRFLKQQNALEKKGQDISKLKYQKQFTTMQNIRGIVKGGRSIAGMPLTPFLTPIDEYSSIISSKGSKKEYNFFKDSYNITHIPVLGKAYYFRKGQGATKQERKEKQRVHTPGFRNRTIREILSPNVDLEGNRKIVGKVVKVVDGDTIKIKLSPREKFYLTPFDRLVKGQRHPNITKDGYYTVRQQGIDTNESVKQGHFVEYFGKDASNYAKEQLLGKTVIVKADYMGDVVDTHNRLLGVVNTIDESAELLAQIPYLNNLIDYQDFHQKLIKLGYAKPIASFKFSEKELYYRLGQIAKEKKIGVWNKEAEERFYLEHGITKEDRKTVKNYQWKNN